MPSGCESQWELCPPGEDGRLLQTQVLVLFMASSPILFLATHLGLQWRENSSLWPGVIQEMGMCVFEDRIERRDNKVTVMSGSPIPSTEDILPGLTFILH